MVTSGLTYSIWLLLTLWCMSTQTLSAYDMEETMEFYGFIVRSLYSFIGGGDVAICSLLLSLKFMDWHPQCGNGFRQITRQQLVGSCNFFGRPAWNFDSDKMVKKTAWILAWRSHPRPCQLWPSQHKTFRDQSAPLGEHLSQKITLDNTYNPIFGQKRSC